MEKVTFFSTCEELMELTGLKSRDELWNTGFNLDDWNYGFRIKDNYIENVPEEVREFNYWTGQDESYVINHKGLAENAPEWFSFWFNRAENYYCDVDIVEYKGFYYFITYHS